MKNFRNVSLGRRGWISTNASPHTNPLAWILISLSLSGVLLSAGATAPSLHAKAAEQRDKTGYHVIASYHLSGDGGWDYISIDSAARRLYVSHDTRVEVLDADSGRLIGQISQLAGVHGVALAPELRRGFTSNGGDNSVTVFDTDTLSAIEKVPLTTGTDFILYDPFSKRVFPFNKKTTVIDAQSGKALRTIELGGEPEAAVTDGKGSVYVNLTDVAAIAEVDAQSLTVKRVHALQHCESPHSLSYDAANNALLVGCRDGFVAVDATSGNMLGASVMCGGVDSGAFDSSNRLIFESCAEGVVSVIQQVTPKFYQLLEAVPTRLWSKTMAFDPKTTNIYLASAELEATLASGTTSPLLKIKPGTFIVTVLGKQPISRRSGRN